SGFTSMLSGSALATSGPAIAGVVIAVGPAGASAAAGGAAGGGGGAPGGSIICATAAEPEARLPAAASSPAAANRTTVDVFFSVISQAPQATPAGKPRPRSGRTN